MGMEGKIWAIVIDIEIMFWAIVIAAGLFVVASVALFIRDGILAKKEGRSRNMAVTVTFILAMVVAGIAAVLGILLGVLAILIMRSM